MTAVIDPVGICNMALDQLRQRTRVNSITEPVTEAEQTMAQWYDATREALLREYIWRFAKARKIISRTGTPEFDWASAYKLPNDYIRFLSVDGAKEVYQYQDYDIEGDELLMNGSNPTRKLRYIRSATDVSRFDPLFKIMLAYQLALNVAYKFTLQKGVEEKIRARITEQEPKLATINAQERPPSRIQRSKFLDSRGGGNYGGNGYFTGPITDVGE